MILLLNFIFNYFFKLRFSYFFDINLWIPHNTRTFSWTAKTWNNSLTIIILHLIVIVYFCSSRYKLISKNEYPILSFVVPNQCFTVRFTTMIYHWGEISKFFRINNKNTRKLILICGRWLEAYLFLFNIRFIFFMSKFS